MRGERGGALLARRGEGGRWSRGEPLPTCRNEPYPPEIVNMHHTDPFSIHICHNACTQVINSSFWVHTLGPHLNTTRQHKQETRIPVLRRQKFIVFLVWDYTVRTALYLMYRKWQHRLHGLSYKLAQRVPFKCSEKMWNMLYVQYCMPLAFSSQSIYLGSENRGSRLQRRRVLRGDTVGPGCGFALLALSLALYLALIPTLRHDMQQLQNNEIPAFASGGCKRVAYRGHQLYKQTWRGVGGVDCHCHRLCHCPPPPRAGKTSVACATSEERTFGTLGHGVCNRGKK